MFIQVPTVTVSPSGNSSNDGLFRCFGVTLPCQGATVCWRIFLAGYSPHECSWMFLCPCHFLLYDPAERRVLSLIQRYATLVENGSVPAHSLRWLQLEWMSLDILSSEHQSSSSYLVQWQGFSFIWYGNRVTTCTAYRLDERLLTFVLSTLGAGALFTPAMARMNVPWRLSLLILVVFSMPCPMTRPFLSSTWGASSWCAASSAGPVWRKHSLSCVFRASTDATSRFSLVAAVTMLPLHSTARFVSTSSMEVHDLNIYICMFTRNDILDRSSWELQGLLRIFFNWLSLLVLHRLEIYEWCSVTVVYGVWQVS
jgi:hypothetical protein